MCVVMLAPGYRDPSIGRTLSCTFFRVGILVIAIRMCRSQMSNSTVSEVRDELDERVSE